MCRGEAFAEDWRGEVARALEGMAQTVRHLPEQFAGSLHDTRGNRCGEWRYRPARAEKEDGA